jgi:hypothetical protein
MEFKFLYLTIKLHEFLYNGFSLEIIHKKNHALKVYKLKSKYSFLNVKVDIELFFKIVLN